MEIDGELPMVSFCYVMVALITTIQLMNTHDRCSKAMKVSNKAMEIIANIIINLSKNSVFGKFFKLLVQNTKFFQTFNTSFVSIY